MAAFRTEFGVHKQDVQSFVRATMKALSEQDARLRTEMVSREDVGHLVETLVVPHLQALRRSVSSDSVSRQNERSRPPELESEAVNELATLRGSVESLRDAQTCALKFVEEATRPDVLYSTLVKSSCMAGHVEVLAEHGTELGKMITVHTAMLSKLQDLAQRLDRVEAQHHQFPSSAAAEHHKWVLEQRAAEGASLFALLEAERGARLADQELFEERLRKVEASVEVQVRTWNCEADALRLSVEVQDRSMKEQETAFSCLKQQSNATCAEVGALLARLESDHRKLAGREMSLEAHGKLAARQSQHSLEHVEPLDGGLNITDFSAAMSCRSLSAQSFTDHLQVPADTQCGEPGWTVEAVEAMELGASASECQLIAMDEILAGTVKKISAGEVIIL